MPVTWEGRIATHLEGKDDGRLAPPFEKPRSEPCPGTRARSSRWIAWPPWPAWWSPAPSPWSWPRRSSAAS